MEKCECRQKVKAGDYCSNCGKLCGYDEMMSLTKLDMLKDET